MTDTQQLAEDIKRVMGTVDSHQDEYCDIIRRQQEVLLAQREALTVARSIILRDLGTEIAEIEEALTLAAPLLEVSNDK